MHQLHRLTCVSVDPLSGSTVLLLEDELWPPLSVWPTVLSCLDSLQESEDVCWVSSMFTSLSGVTCDFEAMFWEGSMLVASVCSWQLLELTLWSSEDFSLFDESLSSSLSKSLKFSMSIPSLKNLKVRVHQVFLFFLWSTNRASILNYVLVNVSIMIFWIRYRSLCAKRSGSHPVRVMLCDVRTNFYLTNWMTSSTFLCMWSCDTIFKQRYNLWNG